MQFAGLSQINRLISDHFPIYHVPEGIIWGPTPFRLDNKWLKVEGFRNLVEKCWQETVVVGTYSFLFASKLKALNKRWAREEEDRFERLLNENLLEMADLDNKEMDGILCEQGRVRRDELRKEVASVMNLEPISWRQKDRAKWVKERDRNTRYFHCMTNFPRKNNYVEEFCCKWEMVEGNEDMRQRARLFFQQLYTEDVISRPKLDNLHFKVLCGETRDGFEAQFTEEEIKGCLDECNGEKAPGPDVLMSFIGRGLLPILSIRLSWFLFQTWWV